MVQLACVVVCVEHWGLKSVRDDAIVVHSSEAKSMSRTTSHAIPLRPTAGCEETETDRGTGAGENCNANEIIVRSTRKARRHAHGIV